MASYIFSIILIASLTAGINTYLDHSTPSHSSPNQSCVSCSYAHKKNGLNYEWLNEEFGDVLNIEYEEPVEQKFLRNGNPIYKEGKMLGKWNPYTDEIWDIHCKPNVVNHSPEHLVDAHVKAFIDPDTRFARLRFTLKKNGRIYQTEPNIRFYELERDFFKEKEICK